MSKIEFLGDCMESELCICCFKRLLNQLTSLGICKDQIKSIVSKYEENHKSYLVAGEDIKKGDRVISDDTGLLINYERIEI